MQPWQTSFLSPVVIVWWMVTLIMVLISEPNFSLNRIRLGGFLSTVRHGMRKYKFASLLMYFFSMLPSLVLCIPTHLYCNSFIKLSNDLRPTHRLTTFVPRSNVLFFFFFFNWQMNKTDVVFYPPDFPTSFPLKNALNWNK